MNTVLRKISGLKRNKQTGDEGKLHNDELHNLHSLPNIIQVIKSRRLRYIRHVIHGGEDRCIQGFGGEI